MRRVGFFLLVFFSTVVLVPLRGQSIGSPSFQGVSADSGQAASKIDSALEAFKNGRWRQVVALFDSIVSNNYFTNNQLYHAAYKSLEKLSEESGSEEKDSLRNRSEEIYQESLSEWGKQVTDGGVDLQVYTIVERNPEPTAGFREYTRLLQEQLQYPDNALNGGVEGKIFVQFIVNADGSVDGVKILKGLHPDCDREAVRLIREGPPWKPGYQQGKPVYVRMTLPVDFSISAYQKKKKTNR